jgi:hypothetical protein
VSDPVNVHRAIVRGMKTRRWRTEPTGRLYLAGRLPVDRLIDERIGLDA